MNNKILVTLLSLLIVVVTGYWLTQRGSAPDTQLSSARLFPKLEAQANSVEEIEVKTATEAFTLVQREGAWQLVERDHYPADFNQVQKLVLGMASLNSVEPKTSRADRYARLQVEEVDAEGAKSMQVTLKGEGQVLAALIVGKRAQSIGQSGASRYYVREVGKAQSWLAEGKLVAEKSMMAWLDTTLFPIKATEIKSIQIEHAPDGEKLELIQSETVAGQFNLQGLGEAKIKSQFSLNQIATALVNAKLQDISVDLEKPTPLGQVTATLADGLKVMIQAVESGGKKWFQLQLPDEITNQAWLPYQARLKSRWFAVAESTWQSVFKRRVDLLGVAEAPEPASQAPDMNGDILKPLDFGVPE